MNLRQVYEITVFVGTPAQGSPSRIVTIHFSRAALQITAGRRQNAELEARKIANSLAFGPGVQVNGGVQIRNATVDVDSLGQPTAYPDGDAGTRAWVRPSSP